MKIISDYTEKIKQESINYKYIYIYGAGQVAMAILDLIEQVNVKITAFCVTNPEINRSIVRGIPVLPVTHISSPTEDSLFILGVRNKWSQEVLLSLGANGFGNILYSAEATEQAISIKGNEYRSTPILEITTRIGCCINCKYCPQSTLFKAYSSSIKEMSLETLKNCVDKTPKDCIIVFSGFAEPFLHPFCVDMIQYVSQTGRKISLYTTLVNVTIEKLMSIANIEFHEVVWHTPDKEGYATIPLSSEYFTVLKKILSMTNKFGEPFITRANCQGTPNAKIVELSKGRVRIFTDLYDRAGNLEVKSIKNKHLVGELFCSQAVKLNHNILLPDGTVVLCCMDYGLTHILGNLLLDSYEDVINSNEMKCVKQELITNKNSSFICRTCHSAKPLADLSVKC